MVPRPTIRRQKEQLSATLAACRAEILPRGSGLARPAHRLRSAVGRHPLKVLGMTCGGAAIATFLLRRASGSRARRKAAAASAPGLLFRWGLGVSQPLVKLWVLAKAKEHFLDSGTDKVPESLPRP